MTPLTTTEKQRNRRRRLNEAAQAMGYPSWGKYETAVLRTQETKMDRTDEVNWIKSQASDLVSTQPDATVEELFDWWKSETELPEWWTNHDDGIMRRFILSEKAR